MLNLFKQDAKRRYPLSKTPGGQVLIFDLFYGIGELLPEVK